MVMAVEVQELIQMLHKTLLQMEELIQVEVLEVLQVGMELVILQVVMVDQE